MVATRAPWIFGLTLAVALIGAAAGIVPPAAEDAVAQATAPAPAQRS